MTMTPSSMLPLGTPAPAFELPDTISGQRLAYAALRGTTATVVIFVCNHCPYVKHIQAELLRVVHDYQPCGIAFIAISSNDAVAYPEDGPDRMKAEAQAQGYTFPYLYDETQDVAHAFHAACTPEFYVFDRADALVYRGRMDAATPKNDAVNDGRDLRAALDAVLANKPVNPTQLPSYGCNIKWGSGAR
ncbi:MAG: thioredoxin family protein [Nevskiaceae bacterium]|nr:MAG: thioredoxin family protein [Nevskiaceae bacterium]TBR73167.1 MAG: thioredoxin family protein [Nevskiaceae bacterium]